jgi:hypothetical protein
MKLTADLGEDSGGGLTARNCTKATATKDTGKQRIAWYFVQISCSKMLFGTHYGAFGRSAPERVAKWGEEGGDRLRCFCLRLAFLNDDKAISC